MSEKVVAPYGKLSLYLVFGYGNVLTQPDNSPYSSLILHHP